MRFTSSRRLGSLMLLLAFGLAACSGDGDDGSGAASSGSGTTGSGGAGTGGAGTGGAGTGGAGTGGMGPGGAGGSGTGGMGSGGTGGAGGCAPCTGAGIWARGFGGNFNQFSYGVAADAAGNVAVLGIVSGSIDFGGGTLSSTGSPDMFVAKLDPAGNHLWSKVYPSNGTQPSATAIAFDDAGNVYFTGSILSGTNFEGGSLSPQGGGDVFLVKLDPMGNFVWAQSFGDGEPQGAAALAVTPGGGPVITGHFYGSINFGGNLLTATGVSQDAYVASFDADGNHIWSDRFGDGDIQYGVGVGVDAAGNVLLAATFYGAVQFGASPLTSAGSNDVGLAKFTAAGNHVWSKALGSASYQEAGSLVVDAAGNLLLTGTTAGPLDFGAGPEAPPATSGFFVAKLDPNGDRVWSRVHGNTGNYSMYAPDLGVAPDGSALVTGGFVDVIDVGGVTLSTMSTALHDVFALKISPAGDLLWAHRYGDSNQQLSGQYGYGAAADPAGNIFLTGYFGGAIDFGSGEILANDAAGSTDVFVAKLAP